VGAGVVCKGAGRGWGGGVEDSWREGGVLGGEGEGELEPGEEGAGYLKGDGKRSEQ